MTTGFCFQRVGWRQPSARTPRALMRERALTPLSWSSTRGGEECGYIGQTVTAPRDLCETRTHEKHEIRCASRRARASAGPRPPRAHGSVGGTQEARRAPQCHLDTLSLCLAIVYSSRCVCPAPRAPRAVAAHGCLASAPPPRSLSPEPGLGWTPLSSSPVLGTPCASPYSLPLARAQLVRECRSSGRFIGVRPVTT